ncbi:MAG: helix-turn-helix domain-containing protein [Firmicutes bacterium]|nr:helix-turn-helix domain-containing protein [Bacillota bacterium]
MLLRAEEVSMLLRVPKARVYDLAREGVLPGVVRIGRQMRFNEQKIMEWIERGGQSLPGGWRKEA